MTNTSLADAVAAYEKDLIQDALKTTRGNRVKAAKLLDSTERIISYKVKKLTGSIAVVSVDNRKNDNIVPFWDQTTSMSSDRRAADTPYHHLYSDPPPTPTDQQLCWSRRS